MAEDPDILDPAQGRTMVGRIVFASLCDKLIDITPETTFTPQLATSWEWSEDGLSLTMELRDDVVFHDGTPFNAEAVVYNVERARTLPESVRKSEFASLSSVEATSEYQVTFHLARPDVAFLAALTDRAGMMVSPTAAAATGADFGLTPVCAGPYRFVERVAQDRIVLEKFPEYWNAENILIDDVTFIIIPDGTVRLANLRAGDLDIIERLNPTDAEAVRADPDLVYAETTGLGYQALTANTEYGPMSELPFGEDARLRQAFSLAIDRDALNDVIFMGTATPGNQPFSPLSPWYNEDFPVPARDVETARAMVTEAGYDRVSVELIITNDPVTIQQAQMLQAMVVDAGFDLNITPMEYGTELAEKVAGNFQLELGQTGWSGRVDPDANIHQFVTCGSDLNDGHYCNEEVDVLLNAARGMSDFAERKETYDAAQAILQLDLPKIYLFHNAWLLALNADIQGFTPYPDNMIRLAGVSITE